MEQELPMDVVYIMRNGEIKVSDIFIPGTKIRGIMLSPTMELVIDESLDNYEGAKSRAAKLGGELLSLKDFWLIRHKLEKIQDTKQVLRNLMGEGYHFYKVPTIKGTKEFYWTQEEKPEDLEIFGKAYNHKCVCIETLDEQFKPDVFFMTTLIKIMHPFSMY